MTTETESLVGRKVRLIGEFWERNGIEGETLTVISDTDDDGKPYPDGEVYARAGSAKNAGWWVWLDKNDPWGMGGELVEES